MIVDVISISVAAVGAVIIFLIVRPYVWRRR